MKLSNEQVKHIAWLARVGLSKGEVKKFSLQLSDILENFEILKEVDTTGIAPLARSSSLQNIFREDKAAKSYPQSEVMANAPRQEDNCFKVQVILE